jgi:hypothetical protein
MPLTGTCQLGPVVHRLLSPDAILKLLLLMPYVNYAGVKAFSNNHTNSPPRKTTGSIVPRGPGLIGCSMTFLYRMWGSVRGR